MSTTDKPAARGRPSTYSQELADRICERLAGGETLRAICRDEGMAAHQTVLRWTGVLEAFKDQYARAREAGYLAMADELLEIADNPDADKDAVQRDRLKVDTRKWLLSKALPKIYGDKVSAEVTGKDGAPLQPITDMRDLARDLAFILATGLQETEQKG